MENSVIKQNVNSRECSVMGCGNKPRNRSGIRFFKYPSEKKDAKRRQVWITAVNRTNEDGTQWIPSETSTVCSTHFVVGHPIYHPANPDYAPSIFPESKPQSSLRTSGSRLNTTAGTEELGNHTATIIIKQELTEDDFDRDQLLPTNNEESIKIKQEEQEGASSFVGDVDPSPLDQVIQDTLDQISKGGEKHKNKKNAESNETFKCEKCLKIFKYLYRFQKHVCFNICGICGRRGFKSQSQMTQHVQTHAGIKPFECATCNRRFTIQKDLRRHEASFHGNKDENGDAKKYKCSRCCKEFLLESNLTHHDKLFKGETLNCLECPNVIFCTKRELTCHNLKAHTSNNGEEEGGLRPKRKKGLLKKNLMRFNCKYCDNQYAFKSTLLNHLKRIHDGVVQEFPCSFCEKIFYAKTNLLLHELNIHKRRTGTNAQIFQCTECPKTFMYQRSLDSHRKIHFPEAALRCPECNKIFAYNNDLQRHLQLHDTSKKSFLCEVCGRKFIRGDQLRNHMFVHTGNAPYQCVHCNKCFATKSNLYDHMQTHPGVEKAFPCSECSERFIRSDHLKRHVSRVHHDNF